jgi:hypothetical protein
MIGQEARCVEQLALVLGALWLPDVSSSDRDRAVRLASDALQSGEPYSRWLLVFDDVTQPHLLRRCIPLGGHVIATSRISQWRRVLNTDGTEVGGFAGWKWSGSSRTGCLLPAESPQAKASAGTPGHGA